MPDRETLERAQEDAREGKAPSTQAGEFVREEIEHVREGKHGVRSTKQAIAIGLSKARRAGVKLPPEKGASAQTVAQEKRDLAKGKKRGRKVSAKRSRAVRAALKKEGRSAVSSKALANRRERALGAAPPPIGRMPQRRRSRTKGAAGRKAAAKKAARTRARKGLIRSHLPPGPPLSYVGLDARAVVNRNPCKGEA